MNYENVLGLAGLASEEPFSASEARPARSRTLPALDLLTMMFGFRESMGGTVTYGPFGGSGPDHSQGLVPDPGPTAGTSRFLNENGEWVVPPGDRLALGDFTNGGPIGTAPDTVDTYAEFVINQTTADQDLELPTPTDELTLTVVMVANGGVVPFTMHTKTIPVNGSATFVWNTNDGAWGDPPSWMTPHTVSLTTLGSHVIPTATIDAWDTIHVLTEAAGFAVTLEDPTDTQDGKRFRVVNVNGAGAFTIQGMNLQPGQVADFHWTGTAWAPSIAASANDLLVLGNFPAGGSIGSAASTVDRYKIFVINQTTAQQGVQLPAPSNSTVHTARVVVNGGTVPLNVNSYATIPPSASATLVWNGTLWFYFPGWIVPIVEALSASGDILSAAFIDLFDLIHLTANNPNLTFTIPNPLNDSFGKRLRVANAGSTYAFTMYGVTVRPGTAVDFHFVNPTVGWVPLTARPSIITLGNFAAGGAIGAAASTVDTLAPVVINQTTAGQTLSLPNPTVTTTPSRVAVSNAGTNSFTMHGTVIAVNGTTTFVWNTNTNTWSA